MTIGERLREARTEKNLSLDDLQELTKIQKRYLVAIEEGKFDQLPGTFYARAFIKEYAIVVGLDYRALLAEHQDEIPQTNGEMTEQYSRIQRSRRKSRTASETSPIFSLIPRLIVILLIVGIIFVAWTLIQKSLGDGDPIVNDKQDEGEIIRPVKDKHDDEIEEDESEEPEEEADEPEEEQEEEPEEEADSLTTEVVELGSGNVPESTISINYSGEKLVLSFETEDRTWLDIVTSSGETIIRSEFAADDSPLEVDVTEYEELSINAGNSPALSITANDERIEFPVEGRVHQKLILQLNKE